MTEDKQLDKVLNEAPVVKVQLDDGAFMPVRAHDTDAGADIFSPTCFTDGA